MERSPVHHHLSTSILTPEMTSDTENTSPASTIYNDDHPLHVHKEFQKMRQGWDRLEHTLKKDLSLTNERTVHLDHQLREVKQERSRLQTSIQLRDNDIRTLKQEVEQFRSMLERKSRRVEALELQHSEFLHLQSKSREFDRIKDELIQLRSNLSEHQNAMKIKEIDLQSVTSDRDQLKGELLSLQGKITKYHEDLTALRHDNALLDKRCRQVKSDAENLVQKHGDTQLKLDTILRERDAVIIENVKCSNRIIELNNDLESAAFEFHDQEIKFQSVISDLRQTCTSQSLKLELLQHERAIDLKQWQDQMNIVQGSTESLRLQLNSALAECTAINTSLQEERQSVMAVRAERDAIASSEANLKNQLMELQTELEAVRNEKADYKENLVTAIQQRDELRADYEQVRTDRKSLQEAFVAFKNRTTAKENDLQTQLQQMERQLLGMECLWNNERNRLQQDFIDQQNQTAVARDEVVSENSELTKQIAQLAQENQDALSKRDAATKCAEETMTKLGRTRAELHELKRTHSEYKDHCDEIRLTVEKYHKQLEIKTDQISSLKQQIFADQARFHKSVADIEQMQALYSKQLLINADLEDKLQDAVLSMKSLTSDRSAERDQWIIERTQLEQNLDLVRNQLNDHELTEILANQVRWDLEQALCNLRKSMDDGALPLEESATNEKSIVDSFQNNIGSFTSELCFVQPEGDETCSIIRTHKSAQHDIHRSIDTFVLQNTEQKTRIISLQHMVDALKLEHDHQRTSMLLKLDESKSLLETTCLNHQKEMELLQGKYLETCHDLSSITQAYNQIRVSLADEKTLTENLTTELCGLQQIIILEKQKSTLDASCSVSQPATELLILPEALSDKESSLLLQEENPTTKSINAIEGTHSTQIIDLEVTAHNAFILVQGYETLNQALKQTLDVTLEELLTLKRYMDIHVVELKNLVTSSSEKFKESKVRLDSESANSSPLKNEITKTCDSHSIEIADLNGDFNGVEQHCQESLQALESAKSETRHLNHEINFSTSNLELDKLYFSELKMAASDSRREAYNANYKLNVSQADLERFTVAHSLSETKQKETARELNAIFSQFKDLFESANDFSSKAKHKLLILQGDLADRLVDLGYAKEAIDSCAADYIRSQATVNELSKQNATLSADLTKSHSERDYAVKQSESVEIRMAEVKESTSKTIIHCQSQAADRMQDILDVHEKAKNDWQACQKFMECLLVDLNEKFGLATEQIHTSSIAHIAAKNQWIEREHELESQLIVSNQKLLEAVEQIHSLKKMDNDCKIHTQTRVNDLVSQMVVFNDKFDLVSKKIQIISIAQDSAKLFCHEREKELECRLEELNQKLASAIDQIRTVTLLHNTVERQWRERENHLESQLVEQRERHLARVVDLENAATNSKSELIETVQHYFDVIDVLMAKYKRIESEKKDLEIDLRLAHVRLSVQKDNWVMNYTLYLEQLHNYEHQVAVDNAVFTSSMLQEYAVFVRDLQAINIDGDSFVSTLDGLLKIEVGDRESMQDTMFKWFDPIIFSHEVPFLTQINLPTLDCTTIDDIFDMLQATQNIFEDQLRSSLCSTENQSPYDHADAVAESNRYFYEKVQQLESSLDDLGRAYEDLHIIKERYEGQISDLNELRMLYDAQASELKDSRMMIVDLLGNQNHENKIAYLRRVIEENARFKENNNQLTHMSEIMQKKIHHLEENLDQLRAEPAGSLSTISRRIPVPVESVTFHRPLLMPMSNSSCALSSLPQCWVTPPANRMQSIAKQSKMTPLSPQTSLPIRSTNERRTLANSGLSIIPDDMVDVPDSAAASE